MRQGTNQIAKAINAKVRHKPTKLINANAENASLYSLLLPEYFEIQEVKIKKYY